MAYLRALALTAAAALAAPLPAAAQGVPASMQGKEAKQFFGAARVGSRQAAQPFGSYAKGCVAGGVQLPQTGPTWQAMRLSRNRNWGHPQLVDFVTELSAKAARMGWPGLYVGDMSQPRGGPMLSGHRSHQMGLDADIWLMAPPRLNLTIRERENLSAVSYRRANGAYVNSGWTRGQHELLKAAASDPRVARIFIFPGAKVQMCKDETGNRDWLRKIRPWWGHHYHFHVRLACPNGARGCVNQAPPPPGDGCADAQQWVNNILNPPKPKPRDPNAPKPKPKRELTMTDLPQQCVGVLQSQ
ncbi:penicillin-insensitive murein endopeptidase [Pelagivirga sediminicola]|uniref:Penicillin-insensitive murein endopeptidase n=1 Tax=Pelagivirga sediminicola TaxID=2170575 RepID=A0A2T7G717_9RHOB|nr:penicillin-insensitive murein endopeptidase [Pelagivirga sediminicola]PVA10214.1 penicillin-insensitive murein endopeptidase [Pelagivirga sediminicola]